MKLKKKRRNRKKKMRVYKWVLTTLKNYFQSHHKDNDK